MYGVQRLQNLNLAVIDNADGPDVHFPVVRTPTRSFQDAVEVHFDNLEAILVREIIDSPVVVGCVAWLTNDRILRALSGCKTVSIIVNKEDFLRPDKGNWSQQKIKELYRALPYGERYEFETQYSYASDPTLEAVRCAGICDDRRNVPPRMHHKFFVFCEQRHQKFVHRYVGGFHTREDPIDVETIPEGWAEAESDPNNIVTYHTTARPVAVWTGSFNASENGTRSLENVVIIRDPTIAAAYFAEWKTILGISEPLDWTSEYVNAEWRIGT